jgi:hypothetical protein
LEHQGAAPRLVYISQIAEQTQLQAGASLFNGEKVAETIGHEFAQSLQWRRWRRARDWCNLAATYDAH